MSICEEMEWTGWLFGSECYFGVMGVMMFVCIVLMPLALVLGHIMRGISSGFRSTFRIMKSMRQMIDDWNEAPGLADRMNAVDAACERDAVKKGEGS